MNVGQIVLTRMPRGPHSMAIDFVKPSTACFVALYTARSMPPTFAILELILIGGPGRTAAPRPHRVGYPTKPQRRALSCRLAGTKACGVATSSLVHRSFEQGMAMVSFRRCAIGDVAATIAADPDVGLFGVADKTFQH